MTQSLLTTLSKFSMLEKVGLSRQTNLDLLKRNPWWQTSSATSSPKTCDDHISKILMCLFNLPWNWMIMPIWCARENPSPGGVFRHRHFMSVCYESKYCTCSFSPFLPPPPPNSSFQFYLAYPEKSVKLIAPYVKSNCQGVPSSLFGEKGWSPRSGAVSF